MSVLLGVLQVMDGEVGRVRREDADHRADYDAPVKSHVGLRMHGGSAPLTSVLLKGQLPFSLFFLPRTCAQLLCCVQLFVTHGL